jgi:hypothetical protein
VQRVLVRAGNLCWRILEWFEAGDKHVGDEEQACPSLMIFVETPQDTASNEFANSSACVVHRLMVGLIALLSQELHAVDEQTVDNGDIIGIVQVVDKRSDDADVHSRALELFKGVWIVYLGDMVPPKSAGFPCKFC